MPFGAKVLFASMQNSDLCLWVEVDDEEKLQNRKFRIYGTGHTLPDDPGRYLGTFIMHNGALVFHIYE